MKLPASPATRRSRKSGDYRDRLAKSIARLRNAATVGDIAVICPAVEQYLQLKNLKPIGRPADFERLALA